MKKTLILFSVAVFALTLFCALFDNPASAQYHHHWVTGQWALTQYAPDGTSYTGRLRIHREGGFWEGRIYFDVLGTWEPLQDVEVTHDSIRFTRGSYKQKFYGHFHDGIIDGGYKDWLHHNRGRWTAQR